MSFGMLWVIMASTILHLINPAHLELVVTGVGSTTAQAQSVKLLTVKDDSDLPQIPYTIDTNEVRGGTKISSRFGSINASTTTTVPTVDAITVYRLKDSHGNLLAYDLYLPENKETIVFNAGNTIHALAFLDPRLIRWPNAERIELY